MQDFTDSERRIIAAALDFMAVESTLADRTPILSPGDCSSAPLTALAQRIRDAR